MVRRPPGTAFGAPPVGWAGVELLRRRTVRAVLGVLGTLALLGAGGCAGARPPAATPTPAPTPIARLNTAEMSIPRIDFCTLVPGRAVRQALRAKPATSQRWGNGDQTSVPGEGRQVVAEHGCAWSAGAASARAWIYAPPVGPALARSAVQQAAHEPHCHDVNGPSFGTPSLVQVCSASGTRRVRHAGLFTDTWLSCEVGDQAPAAQVRRRADAWCVAIATALNTSR